MSPVLGQHSVMVESMREWTGCPCWLSGEGGGEEAAQPLPGPPAMGTGGFCLSSVTLQGSVLLRTAKDGDKKGVLGSPGRQM